MSRNIQIAHVGQDLKAVPYEYTESGLEGVFLHNGYEITELDGERYVSVVETEALHRAIGEHIVATHKELAPQEVRFLRNVMHMTQSELGRWIGQSSQQVARWEKGRSQIPGPADRLLRVIFLMKCLGPDDREDLLQMLKELEDMDDLTPRRVELYLNNENRWEDSCQSEAA